jgi:hypothetical protein
MADENVEAAILKMVTEVPAPDLTDIKQLQRAYHDLVSRVSDLEAGLDNTRREACEARWSVRLLRNTSADLLAPIMLVGAASFLLGWVEAETWWDYAIIGSAGIFGIYWLRNVSRNFDAVTKAP